MPNIIDGFGIASFRSFSEPFQYIEGLSKINIVIGENNSGKSNVARFVRKVLRPIFNDPKNFRFDDVDRPQDSSASELTGIPVLVHAESMVEAIVREHGRREQIAGELSWFLNFLPLKARNGFVWCWVPIQGNAIWAKSYLDLSSIQNIKTNQDKVYQLWSYMFNSSGGSLIDNWLPTILSKFSNFARRSFDVELIPAVRRLATRMPEFSEEFDEISDSATKIIDVLAEYQNPAYQNTKDEEKFLTVQSFLRTVLRDEHLTIKIPNNRRTINFRQHGRVLPLETLGTGVHQAVLLAAAATVGGRRIVCLEEPELHFHPELQRQLMNYLYRHTENQYLITTHSAHIMDAVPCSVYSVGMQDGRSHIEVALTSNERRKVCHRLGYRPSDILQTNCVIWVEGPSDRIYLNAWIALIDNTLEEGWHYSVMFYGGRLLSHLAAVDDDRADKDEEFDDFVQLLPINRFPAILIDSDKRDRSGEVNKTKLRMEKEVKGAEGVAWITAGREVENYVPKAVREAALKKVYKKFNRLKSSSSGNPYVSALAYVENGGAVKSKNFDKVAIARAAVEVGLNLDVLDLRSKIGDLVAFIRVANRLG